MTTAQESFTLINYTEMARLVFIRFGRNSTLATAAWCRLLEIECRVDDFMELVCYPEHTPSCDGWCQDPAQEHDHQAAVRATQGTC